VRRDQLFERRTTFQRQTLLDLQEASTQLARSVGAINHQERVAHRSTGKWSKQLVPDDLDEGGVTQTICSKSYAKSPGAGAPARVA
jgi:hypothetical protein